MNRPIFQDPAWYHALTLSERLASLHANGRRSHETSVDIDLAKRRIQRWRTQSPFTTDTHFNRRLALDGMTERDLLYLLGEPIEALHNRFPVPPEWLAELGQALTCSAQDDVEMVPPLGNMPGNEKAKESIGFLNVIEPLLSWGRNQVRKGLLALCQTQSSPVFDPKTIEEILAANLAVQLLQMLSRTVVLELNVARLQGVLQGETPSERFQNFIQRLRQREVALAILQEYPVLARQLEICIDDWVTSSLEFMHHLCADWQAIRTTFSPEGEIGALVGLQVGAGDKHRGGRSVAIAHFDSGLQVVYKPRSLAVDVHFQELLTWLNNRVGDSYFRTIKILDQGTHGWVEFVSAQSCTSPDQVRRFYERQGAYLALLHVMEATDFHYENLIAMGEYPILVDLESLLHQRVEDLVAVDTGASEYLAAYAIANSVLRVALLPQQLWANENFEGVDISGLGAATDQLFTPGKILQFAGIGSDEMHVIRERVKLPGYHNRPRLNGEDIDTLDYIESVFEGFTRMYQVLLKHRDELLADGGPLARFAQDIVRAIIRPTRTYGLLLVEGFHPDLLRDALDRECHFDRLWVGIEDRPFLEKVILAERNDLWRGNVPVFFTRPNSCNLWSSSNELIVDFFKEPSLSRVHRRLEELGERDLERQTWFILASFTTLALETDGTPRNTKRLYQAATDQPESSSSPNREQLLGAARSVGDRLVALAIRGEEDVCWIGLTSIGNSLHPLPLGAELYSGLTGVSLFLAYLGATVNDERYTALARAALRTARRQMNDRRSSFTPVGAFSGWGGMIYSLAQLSVLWNQPELLAEAESIVEILPGLVEQDEDIDIMSGTAGCIASLLSLYRIAPSERTLDVMMQCGHRLVARAQPMEHGIGWSSKMPAKGPLTGFSHGAAGIAWALLELSALTDEEHFRTAALGAIAYERSLFSPENGNWPDLRELGTRNSDEKGFRTTWCHGAPGIGLARLLSLRHIDDAEIRSEIDTALRTTLSQGFGQGHCLCHGDLGNLDILLLASKILENPQWQSHANRIAGQIFANIKKQGWVCGVPLGTETPGLMIGLAGIGYEFLRLAEPDRIPSILALSSCTLTRS